MHFENFNVYIFTIVFSALENKFHRMAIPWPFCVQKDSRTSFLFFQIVINIKKYFFPLKHELSLSGNEHFLKFMMHPYLSSVVSE